jgi:hypothetical protein
MGGQNFFNIKIKKDEYSFTLFTIYLPRKLGCALSEPQHSQTLVRSIIHKISSSLVAGSLRYLIATV